MKNREKAAINNLNNIIEKLPQSIPSQQIKNNVQILVQGLNNLDHEVKQKEQKLGELQKTFLDKEQKEWVKVLHQRFPHDYPANFNEWSNNSWGKDVVNRKDLQAIEKHLPTFKMEVLKNKFIEVLQQRFPHDYSSNFEGWPNIWGKDVINRGDIEAMEKWIPIYEKEIKENLKQSFLSEKTAKENELKKLADKDVLISNKDQEIEFLKFLLVQKELEKEELLTQKEVELRDKSFIKNEIIEDLAETIIFKDNKITDLLLLNNQLSHVDLGVQVNGNEIGTQVNEIDLGGHHLESQSEFEFI